MVFDSPRKPPCPEGYSSMGTCWPLVASTVKCSEHGQILRLMNAAMHPGGVVIVLNVIRHILSSRLQSGKLKNKSHITPILRVIL